MKKDPLKYFCSVQENDIFKGAAAVVQFFLPSRVGIGNITYIVEKGLLNATHKLKYNILLSQRPPI